MDEDDEFDGLEWDKPQEFVDELPENKWKDGQSTVKQCGISKASHPKVILHIDIDCFYAQVEMIRNPALRTKPVGIQQKYIVVTCNYPAREYGVTKLMSIKDAKEKCPSLVLVNGEDLTHYRHMSYKISEYLQQYCPKVERLGFDENFLDITDLVRDRLANQSGELETAVKGHVYGAEPSVLDSCSCGCHERLRAGSHIAAEIREGLFKELGITCCGGIASNKLLSKLVAGSHKPNQQTTLFPETIGTLMGSLKSVRNIPGIGHASSKQLQELGVVSVKDLQDAELVHLKEVFGEVAATHMQQLANGIDESPVQVYSLPQTLSDEDSFKKCSSVSEVERKIKELLNSLLNRLLEDGRAPTTLRLTVRKMSAAGKYLGRESRQCPIPSAVFSQFSKERIPQTIGQLRVLAMALFNKLVNTKQPFHLTLINVAFAKMEEKSKNTITNFFSPRATGNKDGFQTVKDSLEAGSSKHIEREPGSLADTTENCSFKSIKSETYSIADQKEIDNSIDNTGNATSSINLLSNDVIEEKTDSDIKRDQLNKSMKPVNNSVMKTEKRNSLTKWLSSGRNVLEGGGKTVDRPDSLTNVNDINVKSEDHESLQTDEYGKHFMESINNDRNKTVVQKRKCSLNDVKPATDSGVDSTPKRQRLMENFDDMIPEHIDKAVFYQLPPAIQQEILSSTKLLKPDVCERSMELSEEQTMEGTANMEILVTKDRNYLDKPQIRDQGIRQIKASAISQDAQTAEIVNTSSSKPKTVKSPNTGFFKSTAMKKSGIKTESRLSGDKDSLVNDTEKHHTESTKTTDSLCGDFIWTHKSGCDKPDTFKVNSEHMAMPDAFIPPNVDKETFLSLPSDIQQELVSEWKTKAPIEKKPSQTPKLQAKRPYEDTLQTPSNRPLHFKMPEKSPHNNILSYFPKANK